MSDILRKVNIITANYAVLMIVIRRIHLLEMLCQLIKNHTIFNLKRSVEHPGVCFWEYSAE